jgi:hypothetical protein
MQGDQEGGWPQLGTQDFKELSGSSSLFHSTAQMKNPKLKLSSLPGMIGAKSPE